MPNNPGVTQNWVQICIFGTAIALTAISGNALIAMKRPMLGMAGDTAVRPLQIAASLGLIYLPAAASFRISGMLWFAASSYLIAAIAFVLIAHRMVKRLFCVDTLSQGERHRWWNYALPWTLIGLATDCFFDLDLLLLSGSLSYSEIAVFGVMTRLFSLASFGVSSVYLVALPDMFAEHAKNNTQSFRANLTKANLAAMGIALTMVAGIAVCGPFALSIFGPEFHQGTLPLVILSLALAMRCFFGPAALMLSMHNKPYAALPSVFLGLICLVIGNLVLVPQWGLYGAASSALIAMLVWSAHMWLRTLQLTGTDISIFLPVMRLMKARPAA
jgi:O-antigen/teichoic acid export membrane protein